MGDDVVEFAWTPPGKGNGRVKRPRWAPHPRKGEMKYPCLWCSCRCSRAFNCDGDEMIDEAGRIPRLSCCGKVGILKDYPNGRS